MTVPRPQNGAVVVGAIRRLDDSWIVICDNDGEPVSWIMDSLGYCYWGRYGPEAWPGFQKRVADAVSLRQVAPL